MPLMATLTRDEERVKMPHGYGWWHVECFTAVARAHVPATADLPLLEVWSHPDLQAGLTVQWPVGFRDRTDGEVLTFEVGDRINVWREW